MNIKDFESGQTVFIVNLYEGRNTDPHIHEDRITKIGRKYITTMSGNKYESCDWCEFGLFESSDWGNRSFLCPSVTNAKMFIEKRKLEIWLNNLRADRRGKYSLKQLRAAKEILAPDI